jgi:hypothetical protein
MLIFRDEWGATAHHPDAEHNAAEMPVRWAWQNHHRQMRREAVKKFIASVGLALAALAGATPFVCAQPSDAGSAGAATVTIARHMVAVVIEPGLFPFH